MMLDVAHNKLEVFKMARRLAAECYAITKLLPKQEVFSLVQQINRAAISVVLNIAEGSSRKSPADRKRFYEIARGSLIEIDAGLQLCIDLNYISLKELEKIHPLMNSVFKMLSKMINLLSEQK